MSMQRRRFLRLTGAALGAAAASPLWAKIPTVGAASPLRRHVGVTLNALLPIHAALQYGAVAEPNQKVRVIVQKKTKGADGRAIAAAVGATYLEEFSFIKSVSMELSLKNVLQLVTHLDVLYVSPDAFIQQHAVIDAGHLKTAYPQTIEVDKVWNGSNYSATGAGVTVAVLDSGVNAVPDIAGANLVAVNVNKSAKGTSDGHGHGTHVIGIIKGRDSLGNYIGIAPNARVISVKIADDTGAAQESDLLRGLQWCYDNRAAYGLRVINLSVSAGTAESYRTSPIAAAVEQLWFNGVVVVVVAGNRGTASDATWYAPANDPYVITVGASDDNGTSGVSDDTLAVFSSRGKTQDKVSKPDIVAPGRRIYSTLASSTAVIAKQYPTRIAPDGTHIRLSGTSMAAPVVAGSIALILEKRPNLTPNQIKWLVQKAWRQYGSGASASPVGIAMIDPNLVMQYLAAGSTVGNANQGLTPSLGIDPITSLLVLVQGSYWDGSYWDGSYWDGAYWDGAYWDGSYWDGAKYD